LFFALVELNFLPKKGKEFEAGSRPEIATRTAVKTLGIICFRLPWRVVE
jgi:hypothetical protein